MATFLAIYSKTGVIKSELLDAALLDFSLNGSRKLLNKVFYGFHFSVAEKFEKYIFENETSLSFVSGHISFEKLNSHLNKKPIENFNEFVIHSNLKDAALLEGSFAAIHFEKESHRLTFLNDKFGVFPLFVYEDDELIILSNEYQPLASYSEKIDNSAIAEFLTLGVTLGNKTFYKNIQNLAPASYVISIEGETRYHKYWELKKNEFAIGKIEEFAKTAYELFTAINQEYIDANVSQLCLLTAGADSRLITATLKKQQLSELEFYTSNLSLLSPEEDKDVIGASALAKVFNLNHSVNKISFYENSFDESYFDNERALRDKQLYGGWHGGEFLGGFCLEAAPINKPLSYKEVDKKYKSIFSWWFRFTKSTHPYRSYLQELGHLHNNHFLFMIHQMTRSFFSNIYGGSRGYWLQPFQLMNHGFSPFWDSRFLQLLLQIPLNELENYNFYNKVFKYVSQDFKTIPSNSPLTNREDSLLPKMDFGIEPKQQRPNTHNKAYLDCLKNEGIWKRNYYNKSKLLKILENEFDSTTKQWIDFEVWYARYV
jgi:hypothetical protein